jgi:hypothetical protein
VVVRAVELAGGAVDLFSPRPEGEGALLIVVFRLVLVRQATSRPRSPP